jgi:hypothetical protein
MSQTLEHTAMPQHWIATKVATIANEPIRVADVMQSELTRFRHEPSIPYLG